MTKYVFDKWPNLNQTSGRQKCDPTLNDELDITLIIEERSERRSLSSILKANSEPMLEQVFIISLATMDNIGQIITHQFNIWNLFMVQLTELEGDSRDGQHV